MAEFDDEKIKELIEKVDEDPDLLYNVITPAVFEILIQYFFFRYPLGHLSS